MFHTLSVELSVGKDERQECYEQCTRYCTVQLVQLLQYFYVIFCRIQWFAPYLRFLGKSGARAACELDTLVFEIAAGHATKPKKRVEMIQRTKPFVVCFRPTSPNETTTTNNDTSQINNSTPHTTLHPQGWW
jgi:hypothetical protein